jgi:DNA repair ATPase RecN
MQKRYGEFIPKWERQIQVEDSLKNLSNTKPLISNTYDKINYQKTLDQIKILEPKLKEISKNYNLDKDRLDKIEEELESLQSTYDIEESKMPLSDIFRTTFNIHKKGSSAYDIHKEMKTLRAERSNIYQKYNPTITLDVQESDTFSKINKMKKMEYDLNRLYKAKSSYENKLGIKN